MADDTYRLIGALRRHCDVDAVVDGPGRVDSTPEGARVAGAARNFATADALAGGYDRVFYCLGNSEFHAGALRLLRERPGVVIAHDVRLSGLYGWAAQNRPDVVPEGFVGALQSMYGVRLAPELDIHAPLDFWTADRHGVLMARDAIALSEVYLVHSEHAAQLARLDAASSDCHKIDVIPFRYLSIEEASASKTTLAPELAGPVVGCFGLVSPVKQTEKLLNAWPIVVGEIPDATLAIVGGDAGSGEGERISLRAEELRIAERVVQPGDVDDDEFRAWIRRCDIAVQLRAGSNGETSAAVAQCLAAGVPTIVTNIGSARELPDGTALRVEADVSARELADSIIELIRSPDRRKALAAAGIELAQAHSYERVAQLLYERYVAA